MTGDPADMLIQLSAVAAPAVAGKDRVGGTE